MTTTRQIEASAQNRAWRTLVQGLGIDILVAVVLSLSVVFATNDGWGTIEWITVSYSVAKSVMQAVLAYVMRRWGDRHFVPDSLTPPAESGTS